MGHCLPHPVANLLGRSPMRAWRRISARRYWPVPSPLRSLDRVIPRIVHHSDRRRYLRALPVRISYTSSPPSRPGMDLCVDVTEWTIARYVGADRGNAKLAQRAVERDSARRYFIGRDRRPLVPIVQAGLSHVYRRLQHGGPQPVPVTHSP